LQKCYKLLSRFGKSGGNYTRGQAGEHCEYLWKKMIGKPYSGKLNVRFDEGVLEIEYGWASEALLTGRDRNR
jgi:hypothetical protein